MKHLEKSYQDRFEDLLRSNKERKLKLANEAGFSTVEGYKNFLVSSIQGIEVTAVKETSPDTLTDIVIAFDTTGSMSSYIKAVKKHVKELIPELFKNTTNLKISIVAFGDYCDMVSRNNFGKAYQAIDLTSNKNELIQFINDAQNTSGGDGDEFYELVLNKIKNETSWREGSNKSILLIADADPHEVGYSYMRIVKNNTIDWKQEAQELAALGIKVDTLACTGSKWYKELSAITNGIYLLFSSSQKTADLLDGYTYARSGSTTSFMTSMSRVEASGDSELIGAYKQMGNLL